LSDVIRWDLHHTPCFTANEGSKLVRQNGGTGFDIEVFIDHCDVSDMNESVFRTDSTGSHVTFTNSRYSNIGDALFRLPSGDANGNTAQSAVENIEQY
jgi:hypothetical protein